MNRSIRASFAALGLLAGGLGVGVATGAGSASPSAAPAVVAPGDESHFVPIAPYRALDTREDGNPVDAEDNDPDKIRVGDPADENPLPVPVRFSIDAEGAQIPEGATAVTFNVTVAQTEGIGYLQIDTWPGDPGTTSTVNWTTDGQIVANSGVVLLGSAFDDSGFISAYVGDTAGAAAHVIIDITGYYTPATVG